MRTDFEVYPRKIHVYCKKVAKTEPRIMQVYAWSTNAYRTCREAIAAAKALYPSQEFTASFAKD